MIGREWLSSTGFGTRTDLIDSLCSDLVKEERKVRADRYGQTGTGSRGAFVSSFAARLAYLTVTTSGVGGSRFLPDAQSSQ